MFAIHQRDNAGATRVGLNCASKAISIARPDIIWYLPCLPRKTTRYRLSAL